MFQEPGIIQLPEEYWPFAASEKMGRRFAVQHSFSSSRSCKPPADYSNYAVMRDSLEPFIRSDLHNVQRLVLAPQELCLRRAYGEHIVKNYPNLSLMGNTCHTQSRLYCFEEV